MLMHCVESLLMSVQIESRGGKPRPHHRAPMESNGRGTSDRQSFKA